MARGKQTETATPDFLSRIPVAKEPEKTKGGKKPQEVIAVEGLEVYAAFHFIKKDFDEGQCPTLAGPIKNNTMFPRFIAEGVALGRCPENFKGYEGLAGPESSLQLKRKDTRTTLKPEEVARFQELDIDIEHEVTAPHTLRIVPGVFKNNMKLVKEVMACLEKNGFEIADIFETQLPRERYIVADNTLNSLFAKAKEARDKLAANPKANLPCSFTDVEIRELLEICASVSIGPKWTGTFDEAFQMVRKIVAPTEAEQRAALAAAAKSSKNQKRKAA